MVEGNEETNFCDVNDLASKYGAARKKVKYINLTQITRIIKLKPLSVQLIMWTTNYTLHGVYFTERWSKGFKVSGKRQISGIVFGFYNLFFLTFREKNKKLKPATIATFVQFWSRFENFNLINHLSVLSLVFSLPQSAPMMSFILIFETSLEFNHWSGFFLEYCIQWHDDSKPSHHQHFIYYVCW